MLLMFERGIRGGISQAVRKYAAANSPYMEDKFDPIEDTTYLQYLDANNLDGWAMLVIPPSCTIHITTSHLCVRE